MREFLELFIIIAGFIIGLGAVTVIDFLGFLSQKSEYWTEAITRTHKVTKPLIWIGTFLVFFGGVLHYSGQELTIFRCIQIVLILMLTLNGAYLSFIISPYLLQRETAGKSSSIIEKPVQRRVMVSTLLSFIGWWSSVALFIYSIVG